MTLKGLAFLLALALHSSIAQSEISFEWVTIGDPGNPNDPLTGFQNNGNLPIRGAVPYVYSLSRYETTIGQYTAFLNAVAKSDPHGLYDGWLSDSDPIRGITQVGSAGNYRYHVRNLSSESGGLPSANRPVTHISYLSAVRFVNWLHNGQGNGDTETGAYTISNGQATRQPGARYWIPTENEWYKAAYYDPSPEGPSDAYWLYPWGGDQAISGAGNYYTVRFYTTGRVTYDSVFYTYISDVRGGSYSHYGTQNQAGNVEEWTEGDAYSGGPHTRGGWWGRSSTDPRFPQTYAFQRLASYFPNPTEPPPPATGVGFRVASVSNPPSGGLRNGDSIRFHPRIGHGARMVGGVFEGSSDGSFYTVLYTITQSPPNGWTEVSVNFDAARYFRYRSPDLGHGNVGEIEFYRSGAKVIGAASGTPGSWDNQGSTLDKAFDGNVDTFVDTPAPNGAYVQLDTGRGTAFTRPGYDRLTVTNVPYAESMSDEYPPNTRVSVFAPVVTGGQQFAAWEGFTSILDDPKSPTTTATIPGWGINSWLTATYEPPAPGTFVLEVTLGWGSGVHPPGTIVPVSAAPTGPGWQFTGWTGDIAILSNPFLATTTALIPEMNVSISASFGPVSPPDTIRFYPRLFHSARMVGGVFEGTNGDAIDGPYTTIYTIFSEPPLAWSEVEVDLKNYRHLRYRGPANSWANVAEIEFYRDGAKLNGVPFGTPGSWYDLGNTLDKALDGNLDTFFDAPIASGAYVGLSVPETSSDKIRFYPRLYHTARMVGGIFEGTNGDPINGPYTTVYTISSEPPLAWNEVNVDLKDYRFLRYRGAADSFGNVAEIEFYRDGVKITGLSFGTAGSWYDLGNTFDKALDGNLDTFFDAPLPTGAYVGIDGP